MFRDYKNLGGTVSGVLLRLIMQRDEGQIFWLQDTFAIGPKPNKNLEDHLRINGLLEWQWPNLRLSPRVACQGLIRP